MAKLHEVNCGIITAAGSARMEEKVYNGDLRTLMDNNFLWWPSISITMPKSNWKPLDVEITKSKTEALKIFDDAPRFHAVYPEMSDRSENAFRTCSRSAPAALIPEQKWADAISEVKLSCRSSGSTIASRPTKKRGSCTNSSGGFPN